MSRPLKIQYPDIWYYVMNSGRKGEEKCIGKNDYNAFIEPIRELVEDFKDEVYVIGMAPKEECEKKMFVTIRLENAFNRGIQIPRFSEKLEKTVKSGGVLRKS